MVVCTTRLSSTSVAPSRLRELARTSAVSVCEDPAPCCLLVAGPLRHEAGLLMGRKPPAVGLAATSFGGTYTATQTLDTFRDEGRELGVGRAGIPK